MFLDDSACNLSSINLMKFVKDDGELDVVGVQGGVPHADHGAGDHRPELELSDARRSRRTAHDYRPLGLGYANLGALLMSRGLPYDSDEGRAYAAAITAVMTGEAYAQSARIARDHGGPFAGYEKNREPFLRVMRKHREAVSEINAEVRAGGSLCRREAGVGRGGGARRGLRLPQRAGDRAGADRHHRLHDGLRHDRRRAGHRAREIQEAGRRRADEDRQRHRADGARASSATRSPRSRRSSTTSTSTRRSRGRRSSRTSTCRCSTARSSRRKGERSIHYMGHIKMMGATQPFISGAISKTVNVPREATVEEIEKAYIESWRLGAKAISIYRDGSKRTQPLNTSKAGVADTRNVGGERGRSGRARSSARSSRSSRRRSGGSCRTSATRSRTSSTSPGTRATSPSGLFEDGTPGEIFLVMAKEGSTISGFADAFAQAISYALQYGVPLQALVDKFSHARFEPSGMTKNPEVRFAKSIVDYIFRWMATKFLSPEAQYRAGREHARAAGRGDSADRQLRHRRSQARAAPKVTVDAEAADQADFSSRRFRTRKTRRRAARAARS